MELATKRRTTTPCCKVNSDRLECTCGALLARRVAGGVEVKCKRCKRKLIVPLTEGEF